MRISVDLDGVVANFTARVIESANKLWPGKLSLDFEPNDWNYTGFLTKEEFTDIWHDIRGSQNFWVDSPPYISNLMQLDSFLKCNITDVFFVTSRAETAGDSVQKQTYNWFLKHGVDIANQCDMNYSAIIPVKLAEKKINVMEALGIQASVDDYGPTVEACNKLPNHKAYLLDRPWNQEYNQPRVYSLAEFFKIVHAS